MNRKHLKQRWHVADRHRNVASVNATGTRRTDSIDLFCSYFDIFLFFVEKTIVSCQIKGGILKNSFLEKNETRLSTYVLSHQK